MRLSILSVSAGAGHVRAADAILQGVRKRDPAIEATHTDVMDLVSKTFRRLYATSYLKLVERNPALWGYLYHRTDLQRPDGKLTRLRQAIENLSTHRFAKLLKREQPDVVICTHFLPAQICSRLIRKGEFAGRVWVVVTDFDVHQLWLQPHLDGYCVASDEVAVRLRERAGNTIPITVTGIPIAPAFAHPPDRVTCARELGINPTRRTFLLMSGGFGVGVLDEIAARLLALPHDFQLVALAGRNADLLVRLQALAAAHPGRLLPLPFTTTPERVMVCADLAITKPGGLTTSECLALGLPMLVISPIPGQEERNCDHLLEHGAAMKAHDLAGLVYRVDRLYREEGFLADLARQARSIGRPQAAQAVLDRVLA